MLNNGSPNTATADIILYHTDPGISQPSSSPVIYPDIAAQSSTNQSFSTEISTQNDSPSERDDESSQSSHPDPDHSPSTVVCELPGSYTFDNASPGTPSRSTTSSDAVRRGEANHWGVSITLSSCR